MPVSARRLYAPLRLVRRLPAIGTVFELAWLAGLNLLGRDEGELPALVARGQERLTLAPKRITKPTRRPRERF